MKYIERFTVAVAAVLMIGILALGTARSSRTPAPTARLRPEQIATMPARIQAQLAGTASITATQPHPAPASVRGLRLEQVMTLPPRIQAEVAGTAVQQRTSARGLSLAFAALLVALAIWLLVG